MILLFLYLGLAVAIIFGAFGYGGWLSATNSSEAEAFMDVIPAFFFAAFAWPLIIIVGILSIPYWGGKLAGIVHNKKDEKKKAEFESKLETMGTFRDAFSKEEEEWILLNHLIEELRATSV